MKKLLFLLMAMFVLLLGLHAEEKLLVNENFQSWDAVSSSATETSITKTTNFSNEALIYKISEIQVTPSGWDATRFSDTVASVGYLMAAKSATPYIELSPLASITKVEFVHGATGGSRGFKLEKKVGNGSWEAVSDAYANPASGKRVLVDINGENVALKFTNLNASQNAYLFSLKIYGEYSSSAPQVSLTTSQNVEGAGTIVRSINSDTYDVGTALTLTTTVNFGYRFARWEDGSGNILSTDAAYPIVLDSDKTVKAIFETVVTHSLDVNIVGSSWGQVMLSPEPVEGKFYEVGTIVTATVVPNPVTSFSFWDDGTSQESKQIAMDADKTITATFDEIPFIIGWDFKAQEPRGNRSADYYSETDNKGIMSLYQPDGSQINWLANLGSFSPSYPCIRKWTGEANFDVEQRYYEASFSTIGYENIEVKSLVSGNYQVHTKQIMQYSVDGTTFINIDTVDITNAHNTSWVDCNATLPVEAEGVQKVYIRWVADVNSPKKGTGNDGTALTNVFVFGDKIEENDDVPPILLSTSPVEGSSTASANGSIVLTFNERVKAGVGDATLDGQVLTAVYGSKTATFKYSKLSYNTTYTFAIPSGAITDMSGNAFNGTTLTFTTMSRPQPIMRLFDAIVALDGSGDYTTIQQAIDAAPENSATPYLIFIKNGKYVGHVDIPSSKPFMHMIGQSVDSVIISDNRLSGDPQDGTTPWFHVSLGATVVVNSSNCYFENITFENSWGYEKQSGPQALAMYANNDKIVFNSCNMRSYQDTYLTSTKAIADRQYLKGCHIEGAVDYIYGAGDVFFDECTLYNVRPSGGYIVAPSHKDGTAWGYVFRDCILDGPAGVTTYLGRPWQNKPKTAFINTMVKVNIYASGWYYKMGAIPAVFADYNTMDANGNPLDLNQRIEDYEYDVKDAGGNVVDVVRGKAKRWLTDEEAATYTVENVMRGDDDWDPRVLTEVTEAPIVKINENMLLWDSVEFAICYLIYKHGYMVECTTGNQFEMADIADTAAYTIQAVAESGALSALSVPSSSNDNDDGDGKTSTDRIKESDIIYYVSNGHLYLQNIPNNSLVEVYSIMGQLLFAQKSVSETFSVAIPKGIISIVRVTSSKDTVVFKIAN